MGHRTNYISTTSRLLDWRRTEQSSSVLLSQLGQTCFYIARMLWRVRNLRGRPMNAPAAFIHPCQPIVAKQPPHELKHEATQM
jgi:hypothetical protein